MKCFLLCISRKKRGELQALEQDFLQRIRHPELILHIFKTPEELQRFLNQLKGKTKHILLDERGAEKNSREFSQDLTRYWGGFKEGIQNKGEGSGFFPIL